MITVKQKGDFKKTENFLRRMANQDFMKRLDSYGERGVRALSAATPVDTGTTAASWGYEIKRDGKKTEIVWTNSNENDGVNIAVIIQYGHGTGTGGYVQGIDYINPAMRPIFEEIAEGVWKEVTKS